MKIHFVGIGGIGVSALARYYLAKGWLVSGSDLVRSELTDNLKKDGIKIFIDHASKNVPVDANLVVHSAAVKSDNQELREARFLKIPILSYPEALGELTKQYITLAVAGSHGKSTTTALLSLMLIKAGLDPTVIIGTRLREFGGRNFRFGRSRYLVIEADEWDSSFHYYWPTVAVITNIDKEHLDTFKNLAGVIEGFARYLKNIAPQGKIIINAQDKNSLLASGAGRAGTVFFNRKKLDSQNFQWPLRVPGKFNQLNAEAAWQAARCLGVSKKVARAAVKNYQGSWRRFEPLIPKNLRQCKTLIGAKFFSDYGHHPTEIKAVAAAAREKFPKRKIIVIFQPHQVQRLTYLFSEFIRCWSGFDLVGILPTYQVAGREVKNGRTSTALVREISQKQTAFYLPNFKTALNLIKRFKGRRPVVIFMGAGDIDGKVRRYFKSKLF